MRRVVWTNIAKADLVAIVAYIATDNRRAAQRVAERIGKVCTDLGLFATGRRLPVSDLYQQVVPRLPYVILYRFRTSGGLEMVEILRVIHTARDYRR